MLKHCLAVVFLATALFLNTHSPAAAQERDGIVGTIVEIEGGATVKPAGGNAVKAANDQPIYINDEIEVAKGGRALVLLIDNTRWTLSSGTKFKVDEYAFDPSDNTDNHASYDVSQGAFQYVSGLVAKKPDPDISIQTGFGSIGIRGTDITAAPDETGGYDVYVDEGVINVSTEAGTAQLKQGEGSFVKGRNARPGAMRKDRLQRMRGDVALKNKEQVMQRIAGMKGRQQALQMKFRDYLKNNPEMKQKLQDRREKRKALMQQKMQERKGQQQENRQQKVEQLRENLQERKEQQQERREEMRDNYRERMEERREQRQPFLRRQ